jgi:hypothetical protein
MALAFPFNKSAWHGIVHDKMIKVKIWCDIQRHAAYSEFHENYVVFITGADSHIYHTEFLLQNPKKNVLTIVCYLCIS